VDFRTGLSSVCHFFRRWRLLSFLPLWRDRLAKISPVGEVLVADAGALPCGRLFRPMGELLFIAIKSNQKSLARFRSKARLKTAVQGENVTRTALASPCSDTRFLKTLANDFQPARSNGQPVAASRFVFNSLESKAVTSQKTSPPLERADANQ
jgi:hypothetical protein